MALFPMRIAMERTGLSARQIRHYEAYGLVSPVRSGGGQRAYRLEDIRRLVQVRDLLQQGLGLDAARLRLSGDPAEDQQERKRPQVQLPRSLYPVLDRAEMERLVAEHQHEGDDS
jgi:MerR family glutamine synthetase transcriptional repressor